MAEELGKLDLETAKSRHASCNEWVRQHGCFHQAFIENLNILASEDVPKMFVEIERLRDLVKNAYYEGFHTGAEVGSAEHIEDFWQDSDACAALSSEQMP